MNRFEIIFVCNVFQVLFDALGCLRKYESPLDILKEFFELRLERYAVRKAWLDGMLTAESTKLSSQARFILEKIEGQIIIGEGSIIAHYLFIYLFIVSIQISNYTPVNLVQLHWRHIYFVHLHLNQWPFLC